MRKPQLPYGLYERVVDLGLRDILASIEPLALAECAPLDDGESHTVLARHLAALLTRSLAGIKGPSRLARQIDVCNRVVALLSQEDPELTPADHAVCDQAQRLLAVVARQPVIVAESPERPETPLSISCLLTGTRVDPSLVSQLRKELLAADSVDVLCSFIKWSGIRVLEEELRRFLSRPRARMRIITTSYLGATDPKAVEFLRGLPNTNLKVSYDTRRTRLHAKAYVFHRATGFGTAYVGSSWWMSSITPKHPATGAFWNGSGHAFCWG